MNAFARPGLAEEKLPPVSSADNGKVLGVNNGVWDKVAASGGTTVVANPTLAGTEADLTGLQVGDTKYKVPEGGGGGALVVNLTYDAVENITTCDKTAGEIMTAASAGTVVFVDADDPYIDKLVLTRATFDDGYTFTAGLGAPMGFTFSAESESDYPSDSEK